MFIMFALFSVLTIYCRRRFCYTLYLVACVAVFSLSLVDEITMFETPLRTGSRRRVEHN